MAACAGGLAILLAAIVHASLAEDVLTGLRRVLADRWGVATLLDLLVGLALVAAWIVAVETRRWLAALLVLLLALLGNVTTLAYLMARIAGATEPRDIILPAQGPSRETRGTP